MELPGWVSLRARTNYRTPRDILGYLNKLVAAEQPIESGSPLTGSEVQILTYADHAGLMNQTKAAITQGLKAGFKKDMISIVTYRGREHSRFTPLDRLGPHALRSFTGQYDLLGSPVYSEGELFIDSVHRFKGQSAPCIVFTEIDFEAAGRDRAAEAVRGHDAGDDEAGDGGVGAGGGGDARTHRDKPALTPPVQPCLCLEYRSVCIEETCTGRDDLPRSLNNNRRRPVLHRLGRWLKRLRGWSIPISVKIMATDRRQCLVHERLLDVAGLLLEGGKMQITADLNRKVVKAVQTSMRIEGCKPVQSANIKAQAKSLMERRRVQVSVPGK